MTAWSAAATEPLDEVRGVNRIRSDAGLPALGLDPRLAAAATRHAAYLDRHRQPGATGQGLSAHIQQRGLEPFSGATPGERAQAAGYPHREVLENVSMGFADAGSALEGLMSALYHRLTFLDLEADQLGVATGERSRVFVLGRSDLAGVCIDPPSAALARRPVDCLGRAMTRQAYQRLCADLPDAALFRPSHPVSCGNGRRLDAAFMQRLCAAPPISARYRGFGRYYKPCADGTRLDAAWFDRLCAADDSPAAYPFSGAYFEICKPLRAVHAEWLEAACADLPDDALYRDSGRFRRPCGDAHNLRAEYLDELDTARRADRPDIVIWPPDGATGIPPAFFLEEPDPVPDLALSGYPVTAQFNPRDYPQVQVLSFALERLVGDVAVPVEGVRMLDAASDPNQLLGDHEFAWFPLQRLAWGARYRVRIRAETERGVVEREWSFSTAGEGLPLLELIAGTGRFIVQSGREYLLYLPPLPEYPHTVLNTRTTRLSVNQLALTVRDPNTLQVRVDARLCDRIRIEFDDGRRVELIPAGCAG